MFYIQILLRLEHSETNQFGLDGGKHTVLMTFKFKKAKLLMWWLKVTDV